MEKLLIFCLLMVTTMARVTINNHRDHSMSGAMQILRRLGESRMGGSNGNAGLRVTQGARRAGESPIYFIRLPPTPYYFAKNSIPDPRTPHEKVPVDFTNNGRPSQVYHWNLPQRTPSPHQTSYMISTIPTSSQSTTTVSTTTTTTSPTYTTTQQSKSPQKPFTVSKQQPTAKPKDPKHPVDSSQVVSQTDAVSKPSRAWFNLKKDYWYNGHPSAIYIWRPRKPINISKYKRPQVVHRYKN